MVSWTASSWKLVYTKQDQKDAKKLKKAGLKAQTIRLLKILEQKTVNVSDMITHRLDIREAAEGFRLVAKAGKSLKVIIEPNRT